MQKKTKSLLEELENFGTNRDIPHIVESRGNNIITSAVNLIEFIERDKSRFSKTIKKYQG